MMFINRFCCVVSASFKVYFAKIAKLQMNFFVMKKKKIVGVFGGRKLETYKLHSQTVIL